MKTKLIAAAAVVVCLLLCAGLVSARGVLARFMPITYEGEVMRIAQFRKGGFNSKAENTRQLTQFAIIFTDGFQCEGYDTSLAAVKTGDSIVIRGYHDVKGWPVLDPEWWECDEAQLVSIATE